MIPEDIKSASSGLLDYFNTLPGQLEGASLGAIREEVKERLFFPDNPTQNRLQGYREDVERLTKQMGTCAWVVATLVHSVDEIKRIELLLSEKRDDALRNANLCARDTPRVVRFPNEILNLIARLVCTEPLSLEEALKLKTSGRKWEPIVGAQTLFPKLRKVVFIQENPVSKPEWPKYAFGSLDGSRVGDLSICVSHHDDEDHVDMTGAGDMMLYLGKTFPSVTTFALRAIPDIEADRVDVLEMQTDGLDVLRVDRYHEADVVFPRLTHLSLELDDRTESGIKALIEVLIERRDQQGPLLQEIRTLNLFTDKRDSVYNPCPPSPEYLGRLRPYVQHLAVCRGNMLPYYTTVEMPDDWEL